MAMHVLLKQTPSNEKYEKKSDYLFNNEKPKKCVIMMYYG